VATVSPKVDITPADVNSAAGTFAREQSTLDHLAQVLDAAQGMAGNDKAAATFAARYDPAAKAAWSAFGAGIRTLAGVANGLVTTANNYLKAEAHSTVGGSGTPQQFRQPAVLSDVVIHGPAPSKGDGDSGVPEFLQKFWPNGHPDQLRNAHNRLKTALIEAGIAVGLTTVAGVLLSAVTFGGSDVAAAAANAAEAEAIAGPIVDDTQFGSKVGKHARDYGLDPANPADRAWIKGHIEEITRNPEEVKQGPWNPQGGGNPDDFFFRRGDDVIVTKGDGTFVTILKGGIGNGWFKGASAVK
jgi:hypothetical protein